MYNRYYFILLIIIISSIIFQSFNITEKFIVNSDIVAISDNYPNFKSIIYDKENSLFDKQQYNYGYTAIIINDDNINNDNNNQEDIKIIEGFDNENNNEELIQVSDLIFDIVLKQIKEKNNIPNKLLNKTDAKKLKIFIDPYVNYYLLENNNRDNFNYYNKIGYFIRISPFKLGPHDCSWDLLNKTIAYTCMTDYYFIMAIIKGYRLDKNKIKLVKINSYELADYNVVFNKNKIDILITYVIEDSLYSLLLQDINYNATGFKEMDLNRIKAFYPFPDENYMRLTNLFKKKITKLVVNNERDMLIPSMYMTYLDNIEIDNTYVDLFETFITRLDISNDAYDPTYKCFGDIKLENKAQCNSPIDVDGLVKNRYTIWDKTCSKDDDCPFYKSNNLYDNTRGKCKNNGICEMPVGVQRLGFSKYSDSGHFKPFCYGCEDNDDCCNNQDNPDYVFPNDFDEREKAGKSTIVSKIEYVY